MFAFALPLACRPSPICPDKFRVVDARRNVVAWLGRERETATLFAAAPELLDSLTTMVAREIEGVGPTIAEMEAARAAIAKATGVEVPA